MSKKYQPFNYPPTSEDIYVCSEELSDAEKAYINVLCEKFVSNFFMEYKDKLLAKDMLRSGFIMGKHMKNVYPSDIYRMYKTNFLYTLQTIGLC